MVSPEEEYEKAEEELIKQGFGNTRHAPLPLRHAAIQKTIAKRHAADHMKHLKKCSDDNETHTIMGQKFGKY